MAATGTGTEAAWDLGRLEGVSLPGAGRHRHHHAGRDRGAGRDPASLVHRLPVGVAAPGAARVLGRRGGTVHRAAAGRSLLRRLVAALPGGLASGGFNGYWEMPFRAGARITVENLSPDPVPSFFYHVDYTLTDAAYLHAQWRRSNSAPAGEVHAILDGVGGSGHYVGTYLAWGFDEHGRYGVWGCRRSSRRAASTRARNATAPTAGGCPIRSGSSPTSG
jgi:hypothetical protein